MRVRRTRLVCAIALLYTPLGACTALGPDYEAPKFNLPPSWKGADDARPRQRLVRWWESFGDPNLDALIKRGLQNNPDLKVAVARVDEARGLLGEARASQWPSLGVSASAGRNRSDVGTRTETFNAFSLGGLLSYEIDFWGKYRRLSEAARANLLATEAARDTTRIGLEAAIAQSYFELRARDLQLAIARETLASRERAFELRRKRFEGGETSRADARQAESELALARVSVAELSRQAAVAENALSVLLGAFPENVARGKGLAELRVPPAIPPGVPSALLTHRPDIAAAEQELRAANARIGAARAAYFPTISLTGLLGLASPQLEDLFSGDSQRWTFGGDVSQPLFDGGRRGATVAQATARQRQALHRYDSVIKNAFREVEDALAGVRRTGEVVAAQKQRVEALRDALRLANLRYDNGATIFLEVLDAERSFFEASLNLVAAQSAQLQAHVQLHRALGGGWGGGDSGDGGRDSGVGDGVGG